MLSHILPFRVNVRKSEVGKIFDDKYLLGARGISNPEVVDLTDPDPVSEAASREAFAPKVKAKNLLQSVLDGNVVEDYVRRQKESFDQEAANIDQDEDVDESGGKQRATSQHTRTYM